MIPRGQLDISWSALGGALASTFSNKANSEALAYECERLWDCERPVLACLSVRSGFDMLLQTLAWPTGSEVLMSAVTIPHMAEIVRAHGLVPVPVDVDVHTLAPNVEQLAARITPRTRAILVAHLFGSRLDLRNIAHVAAANHLTLWEDVAQGFAGDGHPGDALADVSFFSFGFIKAQTALGGGLLRVRDRELAHRCRAAQERLPEQAAPTFRRKVLRALLFQGLGQRAVFTAVAWLATHLGIDLDARLSQAARGFSVHDWLAQLRRQPCAAQLKLLHQRLAAADRRGMERKTALAEQYRTLLPAAVLCGREAAFPTHWVLPIRSRDPQLLCQRLRQQGFDATQRGSQLAVVAPPPEHADFCTPLASAWLPQLVFLPLHSAVSPRNLGSIIATVSSVEEARPLDRCEECLPEAIPSR